MASILEILILMDTSIVLIALAITLLIILITRWLFPTNYKLAALNLPPKGPREWPVIGCIPSLIGDEPYKLFADMSRLYGPLFHTRIGVLPTIVLNDYHSIREAFARSGDDFADRPYFGMIEYITKGKGLISAHVGESQRERRRFFLAALRDLGMGKSRLVENITAEIDNLCDVFTSQRCHPFSPFYDITVPVSNVISWIVFGKRFHRDDPTYQGFVKIVREGIEICETTGIVGFIPILEHLPLPVWRKLAGNDIKGRNFSKAMIDEANRRPNSDDPCLVQLCSAELKRANEIDSPDLQNDCNNVDDKQSQEHQPLKKEHLHHTLCDLFGAGTDTTATTLAWAILYMMVYPDIQCKIHEELDKVIGHGRMPALDDRKAIPYTEAVLLEVQRKATIVPLGVPHSAIKDSKLYDYDVPAGTLLMANIWAVHHDPKVWVRPNEFIPERFLNKEQNAVVQRDELIPFSLGRRKCLGEQLAKMELYLFFTHLMHRFEFRIPDGAPTPSLEGKAGATRNPLPYKLCAIPRELSDAMI